MKRKKGLGSSPLAAVAGKKAIADKKTSTSQKVALENLVPNPHQPRKTFDEKNVEALADSIRKHGVIQPLAVRAGDGEQFEIIAGERRFRAAKLAGLTEVPVVVHEISDADSAIFALIENLQREDLNVIEKARGIQSLVDEFELTHAACGEVLGQSRSAISNTLRLLELSQEVQQALIDKSIDMGHARALLSLEQAEQYEVLQQIRLKGLSVRETEALVRSMQAPETQRAVRAKKSVAVKQLETRLSEFLQTKVNISQQVGGNGKVTVVFSDEEMLEKLTQRLGLK